MFCSGLSCDPFECRLVASGKACDEVRELRQIDSNRNFQFDLKDTHPRIARCQAAFGTCLLGQAVPRHLWRFLILCRARAALRAGGPLLSFRRLRLQGASWPCGRANLPQVRRAINANGLGHSTQLPGLFGRERQSDGLFEICIPCSEIRNENPLLCSTLHPMFCLFTVLFCRLGFEL